MCRLPDHIIEHFLLGEHTVRFRPGYVNAVSADQGIDSSCMRYGHSEGGLTVITLLEDARSEWALSIQARGQLISEHKSDMHW